MHVTEQRSCLHQYPLLLMGLESMMEPSPCAHAARSAKLRSTACCMPAGVAMSTMRFHVQADEWGGFDVFRVRALSRGRPLQTVVPAVLHRFDLVEKLRLPEAKLRSFLQVLATLCPCALRRAACLPGE